MRTSSLVVSASVLIAIIIISVSVSVRVELNSASADTLGAAETTEFLPQPAALSIEIPSDVAAMPTATATLSLAPNVALAVPARPAKQPAAAAQRVQPQRSQPSVQPAPEPDKRPTLGTAQQYPTRLTIPAIDLDSRIVPVGVNGKGEMDVPSGGTSDVGWYKGGPKPGSVGSAVLDAHVFAAFKDLRYVNVGSFVYVQTSGGTKLRFKVVDSRVYKLSELTSQMLFEQNDARRLNLITCAGAYIPSIDTYDHRLVVYAIFDGEEL